MAAEPSPQIQSFIDGRNNLRSLTKWLLSGIAGTVTLIVGASTFSKLGSLRFPSWRLALAAFCLLIAGGVCWFALSRAILVLKSEVLSLAKFGQAESGDLADAVIKVSESLKGQLGVDESGKQISVKEFALHFPSLRSKAWADALASAGGGNDAETKANEAVSVLDQRRQVVLQACLSALVELRFQEFIATISRYGWATLTALLIFVYAANPTVAPDKQTSAPIVVSLSPDTMRVLARLPVGGCCFCSPAPPPNAACPAPLPRSQPPTPPENPWVLAAGWASIFVGLTLFLFFRHLARERRSGR